VEHVEYTIIVSSHIQYTQFNTNTVFEMTKWTMLSCRSKQVIRDAVMDNNFLKNLDAVQVREIVDCVYERRIKTGQYVIKEGDPGQHLYVAAGMLHDGP
jgi:hypothetical protein